MTEHLLAIGTRKGLFLARSDDRSTWDLDGPHFPSNDVYSVAIDTRRDPVRLLAGAYSEHWGPTVFRSDDLGRSWEETEGGAIKFPVESGGALQRIWQLRPGVPDQPEVVWAGCEPGSLFRSDDGGRDLLVGRGTLEPSAAAEVGAGRWRPVPAHGPASTRTTPTGCWWPSRPPASTRAVTAARAGTRPTPASTPASSRARSPSSASASTR